MAKARQGLYSGGSMTIYGTRLPGATRIARWAQTMEKVTPDVRRRLKVLDWQRSEEANNSLTARHFGLRRGTIREWQRRFREAGVLGLVERSRKPRHVRRPTTTPDVVARVVELRRQYPAWSKHKIHALMATEKIVVSVSTVGRVLKRRGCIDRRVSAKRRRASKRPKNRFPRGLKVSRPGDFIQIDTKYIMLVGGWKLYQFTAIDVLTKRRVLQVYASQSSRNGARFFEHCRSTFPFPLRAVQTDNGAPFQKEFAKAVAARGIPHYYTYPRHPKQNTFVEISHGADEREFYRQGNVWSDLSTMRQKIKEWEWIWNEIRPHQALGYLTPQAYLEKWQTTGLPTRDVIILQT